MTWDGARTESGWIDLTPTAAGGTGTCRYRYRSGWVSVEVNVTGASVLVGSTPTTIVTAAAGVPADLRPSVPAYGLANQSGNQIGFGAVNTDGSVTAASEGAAAGTRTVLRFVVNYIPN